MHVSDVDTTNGPPLWLPLAHVVVGVGFLLGGLLGGLLVRSGRFSGLGRLAPVHLLLVGWVCVTIMGAMVQFVPVWSGVELASRRLPTLALALVTAGVSGLAGAALLGRPRLLVVGLLAVAGVWLFVFTLGRTLPFGDVTERHFTYALGALALAVGLGGLLALDFATGLLSRVGVDHGTLRSAHVTLAVLGGVVLTVVGALYQLGPMFAGDGHLGQTARRISRVEEATLPVGVFLLAVGRGMALGPLARLGGALVVVGGLAAAVVLARTIRGGQADASPTATRYVLVAVTLPLWCLLSGPAFVTRPLSTRPLGPPAAAATLGLLLAAVLVGTLYHVVPFLVWDHQYADRLGYDPVPMVDDLYDARVERLDLLALWVGGGTLVAGVGLRVEAAVGVGAVVVSAALALAAGNLLAVVWHHLLLEGSGENTGHAPPGE